MKFDPLKSPGDMIDLYTAATPNGWKVSIAFEEMELPYNPIVLKLSERKQHEEWFYQMNPNGRIPVIVDHDLEDLTIFETGAIMLYLAEKSGKFMPSNFKRRYAAMQWLMFQMSGIGPMQGQAVAFERYFPEMCRRLANGITMKPVVFIKFWTGILLIMNGWRMNTPLLIWRIGLGSEVISGRGCRRKD